MRLIVDTSNLLFGVYMSVVHSPKNAMLPQSTRSLMTKEYIIQKIIRTASNMNIRNHEITLALDCGSWRKDFFPYYKHKRKESRDDSTYPEMIEWFKGFENEILTMLPWKVIRVPNTEADDVIGVLAPILSKKDTVVILSKDKDFLQLVNCSIKIVDPFTGEMKCKYKLYKDKEGDDVFMNVTNEDEARRFTLFHVLLGDSSDGIPNAITPDDHYVTKQRAKPFGVKTILKNYFGDDPNQNSENLKKLHHEHKDKIERNMKLIDLKFIPKDIRQKIINEYNKPTEKDVEAFETWCNENNLFNLLNQFKRSLI